jgi:hypothetical protein
MKKILLFFLPLLIISCTNEPTETPIQATEKEYEVVETLDVSCVEDLDCETPSNYLIQSHCPYTSKCIESKCSVVCPYPFE